MKNFWSTEKIIFAIVGGLTIVAIVLIVVFTANDQKQSAILVSYASTDAQKPQITTSSTFADLGKMKVKDEKSADYIIENKGNKPLQLYKISSSCDCTYATVTINGVKSPELGMHSTNPWIGTLDPGKKATLTAIYRPYIMPVSGTITRYVYVKTNDPANPSLTFTLKAFVE